MKKKILLILGAMFLPFIIETIMALIAEQFYEPKFIGVLLQEMGVVAGFAAGLLCILKLPIKLNYRIIILIIYWPVMSGLMIHWGLFFSKLAFYPYL